MELGVTRITPLLSEFTDSKFPPERYQKKQRHWQQIAIHACEQCGRARIPVVNALTAIEQWLPTVVAEHKYVLHPYDSQPFTAAANKPTSVALLVGPEGGLSNREVQLARVHHFIALSLGPRILRAETAPLAMLALLQASYGDFVECK